MASMMYHFFSTSPGFGEYVRTCVAFVSSIAESQVLDNGFNPSENGLSNGQVNVCCDVLRDEWDCVCVQLAQR